MEQVIYLLKIKFIDIVRKHNNCKWAYEELHWLVYSHCRAEYDNLTEEDKRAVDDYMSALRKLHL